MKIVATTQLVVQTMVGCWVLGVGCWVLVYIFYVENIIKKFIIFAQGYSYESGCGWCGWCGWCVGIKAIRHASQSYFRAMMNVISG